MKCESLQRFALSKLRCDAMNRDIMNVLFGGYNSSPAVTGQSQVGIDSTHPAPKAEALNPKP